MEKKPIAIVGMSCRFPGGADHPDKFWDLLTSNSNIIEEIGNDRWDTNYYHHPDRCVSGKSYTKSAGVIDDIFSFDADFFGITPREAAQMDPQQRHLLELVWEALEDGHQIPEQIAGSDCAVYVGVSSTDYATSRHDDPWSADVHFMTGNTLSIAANRISYFYDLHGPSMAIDTACSSSLVATHQACQAIWNKESETAIVGAIHLLLSPYPFIGFSKASMLSPDGICRVFDKDANGYVRSEGGAVLYLKPLADAERDDDPIHAVILASGVNTDGKKNNLTIPDTKAQIQLIESVHSKANIAADSVCYVEAHGTGTPVGDPIETESISMAVAIKRDLFNPLMIGSVKSNLGHLEPASGMAGLLKVIMSIKHKEIPATIGINEENPKIDFKNLNIKLTKENSSLHDRIEPLIMGINSFGFGGSNAHLLIKEYKQIENEITFPPEQCPPLFIYANDPDSLKQRAIQISRLLESKKEKRDVYDSLNTLAKKRQQLKYGLATITSDYHSLKNHLDAFINKDDQQYIALEERLNTDNKKVAFVFSGNGSQWQGMGVSLLNEPIFLEVLNKINSLFQLDNDWSLLEELQCDESQSKLNRTEYAQPLLFAIQVGVFHLLQHYGLKPDAISGHSVGEVSAAYATGALSLEQAVHVITVRSRVQGSTRECGKMLAARISESTAAPLLEKYGNDIELAAINSPCSVTLTGNEKTLSEISEQLSEDNIFCRMLNVDYAFHSHKMDALHSEIIESLADLKPTSGQYDLYSTVTGNKIEGKELTAEYWWQNIRQPVVFADAITHMMDAGCNIILEISPHPVLISYIHECIHHHSDQVKTITTLKRNDHDGTTLIKKAILSSYLSGSELELTSYFPSDLNHVPLPPYPWSKQNYILERSSEAANYSAEQKLLGWKVKNVEGVWENQIDTQVFDFLSDHIIDDTVIFPATGFVELALEASSLYFDREHHELETLEIRAPLIFESKKLKVVQFVLHEENLRFEVKSRASLGDGQWLVHAKGKLKSTVKQTDASIRFNVQVFNGNPHYYYGKHLYDLAKKMGLAFGDAFRGLVKANKNKDHIYSELAIPEKIEHDLFEYKLHPAILDACFHSLLTVFLDIHSDRHAPFVPVKLGNLILIGDQKDIKYCSTELHHISPRLINASFTLFDDTGKIIASMTDCDFKKILLKKKDHLQVYQYRYHEILKNIISSEKASFVPDSAYLSESVKKIFHDEKISSALKKYESEILPLCDALASSLADLALRKFGTHLTEFNIDEFIHLANISPQQYPYVEYLLNLLQEDGKAELNNDRWKLTTSEDNTEATAIWRAILADYPEYYRELLLTADFGFNLQEILSSEPEVLADVTDKYVYASSQFYLSSIYSKILSYVVLEIVKQWPGQKRRLRIAEISHGEENIINTLIHILPKEFCDYTSILIRADASYNLFQKQKSHINLRVESIEEDCSDIDIKFLNGEFDILIINNCLHSNDKNHLLEKSKYLLANSGVLLVFNEILDRLTLLNKGINPKWFSMINSNSNFKFPEPDLLSTIEKSGFKEITTLTRDIEHHDHYQIISAYNIAKEKSKLEKGNDFSEYSIIISDSIGDSYELGQILQKQISAIGHQALQVVQGESFDKKTEDLCTLNLSEPEQVNDFVSNLDLSEIKSIHYIYLVSFDLSTLDIHGNIINEQLKNCMPVVTFANVLSDKETISQAHFWLITSGAFDYSDTNQLANKNINPSQGTLWGLGKTLKNEVLNIAWKQIDIQDEQNYHNIATHIINEIKSPDNEDEIIIRDESRYVLRLRKETKQSLTTEDVSNSVTNKQIEKRYALQFSQTGSPEYLQWIAVDKPDIEYHEVEIKVIAAGLNFRDIMFLSGFLPDEMLSDGFAGANLGLECAGVITRVGNQVEHLKVGDEVISFAPSSFASHVVTHQLAVEHKPAAWSFEEAVTVPTTFFTAYYALKYLARIKAGEKILIHGAAGGVGLAAIQYAKYCHAEVFATAGTEQKRQFLKLLGVDHIFDSRQLSFSDEIHEITHGQGVDIIINSLAGEAVERNLALLKPFGRFLELGKRDFYEDTQIGLKPLRNNIAYFGVDADQLMAQQAELSSKIFSEVMGMFQEKILRPLPFTQFSSLEIKSAFRFMQQSQHIGKVVVSFHDEICDAIEQQEFDGQLSLSSNAAYLISGGYSGLGLATAEHLAKNGAKHIYLLGRRQSLPDSSQIIVDNLSAQGINLYPIQCDVSDPVMLQRVLKDINNAGQALKGIVHAAMVLDDCLITELDRDRMVSTMKPKIQGAWNLHLLTKDLSLDFFIMYSSIASYIGNLGQANYVASNMYLESFAQYRQHLGLPALTVSLDAILDVGALARDEQLKDLLVNKRGITGINAEQALNSIFNNIASNISDYLIGKPNFHLMKRSLSSLHSPTYSELFSENEAADLDEENINEIVAGLTPKEAYQFIINILINELSTIMHLDKNRIDITTSIQDFGIDSLMVTELLTAIDIKFKTNMPITALADNSSIENIAKRILTLIHKQDAPKSVSSNNENEQISMIARQHGIEVGINEVAEFVDELQEKKINHSK